MVTYKMLLTKIKFINGKELEIKTIDGAVGRNKNSDIVFNLDKRKTVNLVMPHESVYAVEINYYGKTR